jgi:hypothetical protein
LLKFLGLRQFIQTRRTDLPAGEFQTILSGNLAHPSQATWASFIKPLAKKLTDSGELDLFTIKRALPEKNFDPTATFEMFERSGGVVARHEGLIRLSKKQAEAFVGGGRALANIRPPVSNRRAQGGKPPIERVAESAPQSQPEPSVMSSPAETPAVKPTTRGRGRLAVIILLVLVAAAAAAAVLFFRR